MSKFWRYNVQVDDYNYQYHIVYFKLGKRVDLQSFHYHRKDGNCKVMDMLVSLTVMIIHYIKLSGCML